jgi:hypothetical protein
MSYKQNVLKKREEKMIVNIVTVYNSLNAGSFLQAYALQEALRQRGIETHFIRREGGSSSWRGIIRKMLRLIRRRKFSSAVLTAVQFRKFKKCVQSAFDVVPIDAPCDLIVLGSDEVWNITDSAFRMGTLFWSNQINDTIPRITYAVSINRATYDDFIREPEYSRFLEKYRNISVRDTHTRNVIQKLTEKEIEIVCDPTMLFDSSYFQKLVKKCKRQKFILLYTFQQKSTCSPQDHIAEIKRFALSNGLELIGLPGMLCDTEVAADPFELLGYFTAAEYVITNTFHGTIFSILFGKRFAVFPGSTKVIELVKQMHCGTNLMRYGKKLTDCFVDGNAQTDAAWETAREASKAYLDRSIGKNS